MKRLLFVIVLVALILSGCATLGQRAATEAPAAYDFAPQAGAPAQESYAPAMPAPTMAPSSDQSNSGGGIGAIPVERIVVQNAELTVVVPDVEERMREIEAMTKEMGGFVVSSNLYQSYTNDFIQVPEVTIVIRVPAERLTEALDLIKKDAIEVRNQNRTGTDVTAEYVDLQSRLKNLEAAEAQLQEILDSAEKTEDVINVFNQLVYYREQIELVKGQIQYYDEAAALSSVNVHLIPEEIVQPIEVAGWKPEGVARDAIQDLINFLQGFANFLIRFGLYTLPTLIMIGIPLYLVFLGARAIFRRVRVSRPKKELVPPPPPAE